MRSFPPGPSSLSPFGVAPEFRRDPLGLVTRALREYGEINLLPGIPGQRNYLVNEPSMIHAVLVDNAHQIEKPPALKRIFRGSFGNGLFFSEGEFWRQQRKLAQPAFHHERIEAYAEIMVRQTQQMLSDWKDGEVRDLEKDLSAMALKIVVEALFGTILGEDMQAIEDAISELGSIVARQSGTPPLAFIPDWAPLPIMRRKRRASALLDGVIYRIIETRRSERDERGDLLSMLLVAQDDDGSRMDSRQLHDEVMTIFIAGHETTALALTWALVLLSQHPKAESRLRAEVDQVLEGRWPSFVDLRRLVYTEMVIKETLRLYPPAWLILRQTRAEMELGGYVVPRRSYIWISPYSMHRHPGYYEDPGAFRPERFAPEADGRALDGRLPKGAYVPFGAGPRICIGNAFAIMEARLVLAAIVQRYRLVQSDNGEIRPLAGATLGFERGAPMLVRRRDPPKSPF